MSSERRPWYPWYPRDFNQDEKVKCLSDDAELLYRRALDVMWQANTCQLPSNCLRLANALARGWTIERFQKAWEEIQNPGCELFKTTDDGNFIYSKRLLSELEKFTELSNRRKELGKIGGQATAKLLLSKRQPKAKAKAQATVKQSLSHTHTHIKENYIKEKKPTGVPDTFPVTDNMTEYAKSKNFHGDTESLTEDFILYYRKTGKKHADWYAAWQTWLRNQIKFDAKKKKPEQDDDYDPYENQPPIDELFEDKIE